MGTEGYGEALYGAWGVAHVEEETRRKSVDDSRTSAIGGGSDEKSSTTPPSSPSPFAPWGPSPSP
jgi:hypothetical protein